MVHPIPLAHVDVRQGDGRSALDGRQFGRSQSPPRAALLAREGGMCRRLSCARP